MQKIKKIRRLCAIAAAVLFASSIISLFMVFRDRKASHLTLWKIQDESAPGFFYWQPEDAPEGFYFDRDQKRLALFADELKLQLDNRLKGLDRVRAIAGFVSGIIPEPENRVRTLAWGSAWDMRTQLLAGAQGAHCFHLSVLFSTYLASQGFPSRLWALENDVFDGIAHTVIEVFIADLNKWVFFDIAQGFYAAEAGVPLSLLEFRRRLLSNDTRAVTILFITGFTPEFEQEKRLQAYTGLIKTVFLRTNNVFTDAFGSAGPLPAVATQALRVLPNQAFLGLRYVVGRDRFIHYADKNSPALERAAVYAKAVFYFSFFSFLFALAAGIYFVSSGLRGSKKKDMP